MALGVGPVEGPVLAVAIRSVRLAGFRVWGLGLGFRVWFFLSDLFSKGV